MKYNLFDLLPEKAFQPIGKRMTLEGGGGGKGSYSAPPPPPPAPAPEATQSAVAPASDSSKTAGDGATVDANRSGKSMLRIDLDPLTAGKTAGTSGGSGLAITG